MSLNFDNKVVLVTGAAQGIGRAIAEVFRDAGAHVHLCDIDQDGLDRNATALGLAAHTADLSNPGEAADVVAAVVEARGRIDILALSAGGVCGQVGGRPIEDFSTADWHALFAANVDGAFHMIQAAAPLMRHQASGRIVTISSSAGLRPSLTGIPGYTAAKHALVGLTRQASAELGPHGVTVNSVAPGLVLSNPNTVAQWEAYGRECQQQILSTLHTGRLGKAEDIASAVLFLSSDAASWITGQVLAVDGGRL